MSDHATERRIINATPQQCFDVITDFESYPEWAEDVKSVSVLEIDESGLGGDVRFRAAAMGLVLPIHSGTTTEVILSNCLEANWGRHYKKN